MCGGCTSGSPPARPSSFPGGADAALQCASVVLLEDGCRSGGGGRAQPSGIKGATHHIHVVRPSLGREALGPRRLRGRTPPVSLLGSHGSAGGHGVSSCNVASPASVPHGTLHGTPPPGSHNHGSSHRRRSVTDIPRGGGGGAAPTLRRPRPRTSDVSRSARPAAAARGGRVRRATAASPSPAPSSPSRAVTLSRGLHARHSFSPRVTKGAAGGGASSHVNQSSRSPGRPRDTETPATHARCPGRDDAPGDCDTLEGCGGGRAAGAAAVSRCSGRRGLGARRRGPSGRAAAAPAREGRGRGGACGAGGATWGAPGRPRGPMATPVSAAWLHLPDAFFGRRDAEGQDEEKAGKTVGAHWRRSGELREKRFGMRRMRMKTRGSPKSARRIFSERTRLGSAIYPEAVSSSLINPEAPSYVAVEGDLEAASPAEAVLVAFCL
ncbi:hypothetical protein HPB47_008583 [Ixodes persulcatus]|uniref:Uncharacterized protein n=1 Tax=Ixodes persulcatus TaxID=34615 RepID=A0AC60P4A7_IXOPE|nr:hypothetical protein HPB47_008583 [Ixodes persulcatus]